MTSGNLGLWPFGFSGLLRMSIPLHVALSYLVYRTDPKRYYLVVGVLAGDIILYWVGTNVIPLFWVISGEIGKLLGW